MKSPQFRRNWLADLLPIFAAFWLATLPCRAQTNTSPRDWNDYHTIMWVGDSPYRDPARVPLFFQRLQEMGINTAMVYGDGDPQPLLTNRFAYYVENMINRGLCLKFSSKVQDWDKFVTGWTKNGRPESAFLRDYCLDDPTWRDWARKEMQNLIRKNAPHNPLAYDIRDELSVTISANPFDYDFNPLALAGFRDWLKTQYPSLAALNTGWETSFASWGEVKPFTTDQIKNRMASGEASPRGKPDWQSLQQLNFSSHSAPREATRWNFSPWADFRTYMDVSLARTLDDLRQAAHVIDPRTPVGIEGTQMPSAWGGYDLWRLSRVLDWVEPYDIGNAREIFGSFMPGKPIVATIFENDASHARRRLWHLLLEGDRGCLVWWSEDCIDWKSLDYALTAKAKALAPALREMTSPLAKLFILAQPEYDPIAFHYSQSSIQIDWLLESIVDGSTWHRRFSSFEGENNQMLRVRDSWLKAFQDLGYSPRFVSSEQIARGELERTRCECLVLASSFALGNQEVDTIKSWLNQDASHALFANDMPGTFDEHGKLRPASPLAGLFPPASSLQSGSVTHSHKTSSTKAGEISKYAGTRLNASPDSAWPQWIATNLSNLHPAIEIPLSARVRVHRYRLGSARLLAFERNISYQMSEELKQAGGNEILEKPAQIVARLNEAAHVYDLRTGKYLGQTNQLTFTIDPWEPSLFALLPQKPREGEIIGKLLAQDPTHSPR
jgi:hypothetical protein